MFLLVFYIPDDGVPFFYRMCKGAVAILPVGKSGKQAAFFHPATAPQFNVFDVAGKRKRGMQVGEDVQVVFGAINAIKSRMFLLDYAPDIFIKAFLMLFCKGSFTMFGGEDKVIEDLFVGAHAAVGFKKDKKIFAETEMVSWFCRFRRAFIIKRANIRPLRGRVPYLCSDFHRFHRWLLIFDHFVVRVSFTMVGY
jgi:hypothetical protein